ncbi:MAG: methyltransferase domain-containing protein [Pseudomonadota bacterium]
MADSSLEDIRAWFATPLGQHVVNTQAAALDQLLPGFFGYNLLQLGIQEAPLFGASHIQNKMTMGLRLSDNAPFIGQPTSLPFESDSMDVVLLHHLLEFSASPQQILREVARVTISMGHVVIIGFNPFSLWGLWKTWGRYQGKPPWVGHFIRPGRLMDWLNILNFKIDRTHYSTYGVPVYKPLFVGEVPDYSQGLSRRSNLPFGAVYVIVARKHVGTMTPIRPVWKSSRAFGQLTIVRPTSQGASRQPPEGGQ